MKDPVQSSGPRSVLQFGNGAKTSSDVQLHRAFPIAIGLPTPNDQIRQTASTLTLLVPGGFGSKISRGGGQFDPGFYFELLTPKIGVLTILVYSIVNRSTNA